MTLILPVQPRAKDLIVKSEGQVAAVVYGPKFPSTNILVDKKEMVKTFKSAGESTIIQLQGLSSPVEVLIKDVTFSPIKGEMMHVDFYVMEKGKEMTADIPLHFIGVAPAEKMGAVINKVMHEVTVVCQPQNLPAHIDVDLGKLIQAEDKIHILDLVCPVGVKITQDENDVVALAEMVVEEVEVNEQVSAADVSEAGKVNKE